VRLLVQRHVAVVREVGRVDPAAVDERRDVEEALGAQEVAVARLAGREHGLERAAEDGSRHGRQLAGSLQLPALGREAHRLRDRLDERRLAAAVVAREQRHGRVAEPQPLHLRDRRDVEREPVSPALRLAAQREDVRAAPVAADVTAARHERTVHGF
jgi:hypothetical protein